MKPNDIKLGILGFGNMGSAICDGLLRKNALPAQQIYALGRDREKLSRAAEARGIHAADSAESLARLCDVLLIGVLPEQFLPVLSPIAPLLEGKWIVSIAAGIDASRLNEVLPASIGHISTIPNTPVKIGEGIIVSEAEHTLTAEQKEQYEDLFGRIATIEYVPSHLLALGGTLAGCTPAFTAMMIEALGDAGVKHGMPRPTAYRLAAQMLAGTGRLARETGAHPALLKDEVCSPGGTTIRGVTTLEETGFRSALIAAIDTIMAAE